MIQDIQEYDDFMGLWPWNYFIKRYYLNLRDWIIGDYWSILIGEAIQSLPIQRS